VGVKDNATSDSALDDSPPKGFLNANTKGWYGCEGDQDVTSESCLIFEHLTSYSLSDFKRKTDC